LNLASPKQNESCRLTIQNGDSEYAFDLNMVLAFGIFANDQADNRYLALGVAPTEQKGSTEDMDQLLIRIMTVMLQTYQACGISNISEMQDRVRSCFHIAAAQHIRETRNVSPKESLQILRQELKG